MNAPPEIWRAILRHATFVPGVYSGPEGGRDEEEMIRTAMQTKVSMNQACRTFRDLTQQFLYEIVVVRRFERIGPLVQLLSRRDGDSPGHPPTGWWCRRLDVLVSDVEEDRLNGLDTLWGLLPSCPRVLRLRVGIEKVILREGYMRNSTFPSELITNITNLLGPTLRQLRLDGRVQMHPEQVQSLLSSMTSLEECHINRVVLQHTPHDKNRALPAIASPEFREHMDDEEILDVARMSEASWLKPMQGHFCLPRLHTLDVQPFIPELFSLPLFGLRFVTVSRCTLQDLPVKMSSIESAFASYADSITHLTFHGEELDMWNLVRRLPRLKSLAYDARFTYDITTPPCPPCPLLGEILLHRYRHFPNSVRTVLDNLLLYITSDMLPAIRVVRVEGDEVGEIDVARRDRFQERRVVLEMGGPRVDSKF